MSKNAYVIKRWQIASQPIDESRNYVIVEGRAGGFISWLLSLVQISPIVKMEINSDRILFHQGSLEGTASRIIPLENISSTFYGYTKPWKEALILGIVLGVFTFGIGAIFGIIYYFLNKHLTVGFVEVSGVVNGVAFKRSVIEGQNIDENQARAVAEITQQLIDARKRPSAGTA
jgi:hypothetical protein